MNRVGVVAVGLLAALGMACGSNPAKYLVALNQAGLATLPGSCYPNGNQPNPPPQITELISHEFTVWEGAKGKRYLEIDQIQVSFPSPTTFGFSGLVEGGPKAWTYTSSAARGATTELRQMAFTFADLGATLEGTIAVTATFTCASPPCGFQDCSVTLGLNGRQIDASGQL